MEDMVMEHLFWQNKRVLVTGHTGFKGGWLSLWLSEIGANVCGYSLEPNHDNQFYRKVYGRGFVGEEYIANIMDAERILQCINSFKPQIIFHLAAQPLVRASYTDPLTTFNVNIMGVVNLLEAVRRSSLEPTIVNVTTDKVYANNEWIWAYRESEPLGGNDPYSASKACSEIITSSYINSFFKNTPVKIATARSGNVIGGGDMSIDRLVPDYLRSYANDTAIVIRNPLATRPWQHILDSLLGYLMLAEKMYVSKNGDFLGAWNFGPNGDPVSVEDVIEKLSNISSGKKYQIDDRSNPHEAQALLLDSSRARKLLNWKPKIDLDTALKMTFDWFKLSIKNNDMKAFSTAQLYGYRVDEKV